MCGRGWWLVVIAAGSRHPTFQSHPAKKGPRIFLHTFSSSNFLCIAHKGLCRARACLEAGGAQTRVEQGGVPRIRRGRCVKNVADYPFVPARLPGINTYSYKITSGGPCARNLNSVTLKTNTTTPCLHTSRIATSRALAVCATASQDANNSAL